MSNPEDYQLGITDYRKFYQHLIIEGLITERQYQQIDQAMDSLPSMEIENTGGFSSCSF